MADVYEVAAGHDNAAGLTALTWQPATPTGFKYPAYRWSAAGMKPQGGAYYDLDWPEATTTAQRALILSELGLTDAVPSAELTMRLQNNNDTWSNYNVLASYLGDDARVPGTGTWTGTRVRLTQITVLT